ncbi:MAG: TM0106 family RecB-like putative nuclease [Deltaproteobacteria bacterium]|nr:MAG: TM0106 family RecB-like putative nuclease [Deltaproteobacteria bacterium]
MRIVAGQPRLSASDVANHLGCRHLTTLDLAAARGLASPPTWKDPALEVLEQRGFEHERTYVDHLRALGMNVVDLRAEEGSAVDATTNAMRRGIDVIVQATLASGRWYGRADILRRVARPSSLGDWSYEVVDTKLARDTRAGTVLQLCLYSDIVGEIQGRLPESMHVVSPGTGFEPETFRVLDYLAYYRLVQRRLEAAVGDGDTPAATYPDPVPQCDICRWWPECDRRRRDDDHLCLVAGISKLQQRELRDWGIDTLTELARLPLPLPRKPRRGAADSYVRLREQARVQLEGRTSGRPVYELLPREPGRGLARLPEPSPGDMFFDIEGDAFVGTGGLDYLLGWVVLDDAGTPEYRSLWAIHPTDEKQAFEAFVDEVMARWARFPEMHIYHFAPYEPGAMKRLMGRHATREGEVDRMLRAGLFVDLYAAARQALRASVERYSIKDLEPFYDFERDVDLREASANLRAFERALELDQATAVPSDVRRTVERYNRDDCVSTLRLREWLKSLRADLVDRGEAIDRPRLEDGAPNEAVHERQQQVAAVMERLLRDVPAERSERSAQQHARWLLAHMLDWHRREEKAPWWEHFRLESLDEQDLLDERAGLAGLEFVERVGGSARCPVHRYRFAPQDSDIRDGDPLHQVGGAPLGSVERVDPRARTIDIKKRADAANDHPTAVYAHTVVTAKKQAESLLRLGEWVAEHGVDAPGPYRAARDLLLARPPRLAHGLHGGGPLDADGESALAAARRLAKQLRGGVLAIQGPPGTGKTYTGARMICELIRDGNKVGITAVSHKVIRNLLDEVVRAAADEGVTLRCIQKVAENPAKDQGQPIEETTKNAAVLDALVDGDVQVAAGTAWLWAREEFVGSVDVLFVDEAGQMSLANVLAVAAAARNVVLLGDPRQLEQPQQGSHPEGTDVSALEHLLEGRKTIPPDRGLFLAHTWRLHPSICALTSELFYDSRLQSQPDLDRQALVGTGVFDGAGLWFVPVDHHGNQNSSSEEVDRVAELYATLLQPDSAWIDYRGDRRRLTPNDILIVAPYNAQVGALGERLPNARIGTVDKFQGQQAPVVIYSMATSSPDDAPRGMEFLFSLNRLNVATSRARCACILVASPRLFEPECRTPRQIQLANAFCRYLELARTVP